jgi:hypothetical protein
MCTSGIECEYTQLFVSHFVKLGHKSFAMRKLDSLSAVYNA